MPFKWLALESHRNMEFSTKSDVLVCLIVFHIPGSRWSFAVLLFELFSFGDAPYPTVQQADLLAYLTAGNRLSKPELAEDDMSVAFRV